MGSIATGSPSCQQRARYRVTAHANVVDANKLPVGEADEGELFVLLVEPVHVDNRRYGTVGSDTGYVLMEKLTFVDTVTFCA